jgi:hypothetical protein
MYRRIASFLIVCGLALAVGSFFLPNFLLALLPPAILLVVFQALAICCPQTKFFIYADYGYYVLITASLSG